MRSLKMRLLVSTCLTGLIVLSLLGVCVYVAMQHALFRDFDSGLRADSRRIANMIQQRDRGRLDLDFDYEQMPEFRSQKQPRFFQVWQDDGKVLEHSRTLGETDLPRPEPATGTLPMLALPDGRVGRAMISEFEVERDSRDERRGIPARRVSILVAAEPTEVIRTLRLLRWLLTSLCLGAIVILCIVLLSVVAGGVRPVSRLAADIDRLSETALSHRLRPNGVPSELRPVVDKLNGVLVRLEAAFDREKSFTADVAHELRTPLAGLRMTMEVCRSQPRETQAYEAAMDECLAITDRLEAMMESLLMLARTDGGQIKVERTDFNLCALVHETWRLVQHRAAEVNVTTEIAIPDECLVNSDPAKLRIVVQNLLDNALSYVNRGGNIRIAMQRREHGFVLEIANSGSAIASEDIPKLFERFWRGDASRTDTSNHSGLGLSLSKRLMALLGSEIRITSEKDGLFVVQLLVPTPFPSADPASNA
jgi:two-component system sensor histidine kinase QseC